MLRKRTKAIFDVEAHAVKPYRRHACSRASNSPPLSRSRNAQEAAKKKARHHTQTKRNLHAVPAPSPAHFFARPRYEQSPSQCNSPLRHHQSDALPLDPLRRADQHPPAQARRLVPRRARSRGRRRKRRRANAGEECPAQSSRRPCAFTRLRPMPRTRSSKPSAPPSAPSSPDDRARNRPASRPRGSRASRELPRASRWQVARHPPHSANELAGGNASLYTWTPVSKLRGNLDAS